MRQILERVEDDSSSLIALREASSFNSSRAMTVKSISRMEDHCLREDIVFALHDLTLMRRPTISSLQSIAD